MFTFQTAGLLLDWGGSDEAAFGGPFPDSSMEQFAGYGVINLVIFAVGLGLVTLGCRLRDRRQARVASVELAH